MLDRCAIVHFQIHFFAANVIGRICRNVTHAGTQVVSAGFASFFCCNLWSQPITISKLLCFRFRIAEQHAAMLVKWTNERLKGVGGRSALAECSAGLAESSAAEKKEEVATGNWSKNFIWLLLTIFLTFILAFFLMLFIILFLLRTDFILKLKMSILLMVFLNLALLMLMSWLVAVMSPEVVEDFEEVENDEFEFEIEDYEELENLELEIEDVMRRNNIF